MKASPAHIQVLQAFNPFTDTPVEGTHWRKGPTFGQPANRFAAGKHPPQQIVWMRAVGGFYTFISHGLGRELGVVVLREQAVVGAAVGGGGVGLLSYIGQI